MKILSEWDEGNFHYVLREVSPGHTTLGKYPAAKKKKVKKKS